MSELDLYFELGREHIMDYKNGYDHILFVVVLCALYTLQDWRKVLVLVTAFTVGHSITLALATLNIISFPQDVVEFLIPLTIFITGWANILRREDVYGEKKIHTNYAFALFFGLIHGMGFSNYLRAMLASHQTITGPLFAFNVGLEFGQIIIVMLFLTLSFIFVDLFGASRRDWRLIVSAAISGIAFIMMKDRVYW